LQHLTFNMRTGDGLRLSGQVWQPDGEARAAVALVHGLGEHSGRYTHVAEALTEKGYALLGFDLRGHGNSEGQRGHAPSWDTLLDDIDALRKEAAIRFAGRPLFLYGHSFGGNLVLSYVLQRRPAVAGAVVTAPILRSAFRPPAWKIKLGEALYNLWPTFALGNEVDPTGLSHDGRVVSAYVNDPLVHSRISARMGLDMLRTGEWVIAHAQDLSIPLLLMHGAADRLCSFEASREFANHASTTLCTFKPWDNLYHELHNEPEQNEVLQTMIGWLDAHLPA